VGGRPVDHENTFAEDGERGSGLTADRAAALLMEACTAFGMDSAGARLLRLGSNAVYRLAAPVVVRRFRRFFTMGSLNSQPVGGRVGQRRRAGYRCQSVRC
jgi:hypothetical protein